MVHLFCCTKLNKEMIVIRINRDDFNCKYCNVKLTVINNDIVCNSCGLLYEVKYSKNEDRNYCIPIEY